jgi:hypothetical protein
MEGGCYACWQVRLACTVPRDSELACLLRSLIELPSSSSSSSSCLGRRCCISAQLSELRLQAQESRPCQIAASGHHDAVVQWHESVNAAHGRDPKCRASKPELESVLTDSLADCRWILQIQPKDARESHLEYQYGLMLRVNSHHTCMNAYLQECHPRNEGGHGERGISSRVHPDAKCGLCCRPGLECSDIALLPCKPQVICRCVN